MKTLLKQRSYLRGLTPEQRRKWFEQKKRLTPRVVIGKGLPRSVLRSYAYISLK
jgi:hypothetical protein